MRIFLRLKRGMRKKYERNKWISHVLIVKSARLFEPSALFISILFLTFP